MPHAQTLNVGRFEGQPFWSGAFDLGTSKVLKVWPYETAMDADFHIDFYWLDGLDVRFHDGQVAFFCINGGALEGETVDAELGKVALAKIAEQVEIREPRDCALPVT